ncbi:MAG: cell division protein FtsL [Paenisporosarcina sp.]
MAMHARSQQTYIKQPVVNPQPVIQPIRKHKKIFSKGEKILFVMFIAVVAIFSVMILQTQASIHKNSQEIQSIEHQIAETKKQNTDLSIQVSELSTYERIWEKAKGLGLELNEKNVKVVQGQ